MTPNELRELCGSNKGPLAFATAFSDLDEAARKTLSTTTQDIYREVRKREQADWVQVTHRGSLARLAILACCPWSQVRRVHGARWRLFDSRSEHWPMAVVKILTDRRPEWAGNWVNLQLDDAESEWQSVLSWQHVRQLVNDNVIQRPTSDGYVRMLASSLHGQEGPPIDDDLVEHDLWRLFEVPSAAFAALPPAKDVDRQAWAAHIHEPVRQVQGRWIGGGGWPRAIYHLAATGRIDRGRLIDAVLGAFWRDFNTQVLSTFARFHEILEPTEDEISLHEPSYLELLRCEYGPAVNMAIRALGRLNKSKRLNVPAFLECVLAVFSIPAKSQPVKALALIERVAEKAVEHRPAALQSMAAALNHESPDVQEKALGILTKWKSTDKSLDLSEILELATMTAPQHRRALESLAGKTRPELAPALADDALDSCEAHDLDAYAAALLDRLAAIPLPVCQACGLSDLSSAIQEGRLPGPFDPHRTACPVLSGVEPIEPIRDVDELIDVTAQVLAGTGQPEDEERVVDGIFRLGQHTTDHFEGKTAGLRQAVETRLQAVANWMGGSAIWQVHALPLIVGRWLRMTVAARVVKSTDPSWISSAVKDFLNTFARPELESTMQQAAAYVNDRLTPLDWKYAELFERLGRDEYGPVLSTPTHASGWIDPRVFVSRLLELHQRRVTIGKRDFTGALLRLASDFRDVALASTGDIAEPHRRIVRYALGGDAQPTKNDRSCADEWLAAGRARNPRGQLADLAVLHLSPDEPDGITPATYALKYDVDPSRFQYARWSKVQSCLRVTPDEPGKGCRESRPTVGLAVLAMSGNAPMFSVAANATPLATLTPANTDWAMAAAAYQLLVFIDEKGYALASAAQWMLPLFQIDRGWSEVARVTLCLGLLSRDDQVRGTAIDALTEGILDGRADVERLSETLLPIATAGWVKPNRLADSLREVSRASVLAERVVSAILDRLIASWHALPRGSHHVLSLQIELLTTLRHALSSQAQAVLSRVKGSGKAAKLARQLCEITADRSSSTMRRAALEAADGRLARAERIVAALNDPA